MKTYHIECMETNTFVVEVEALSRAETGNELIALIDTYLDNRQG